MLKKTIPNYQNNSQTQNKKPQTDKKKQVSRSPNKSVKSVHTDRDRSQTPKKIYESIKSNNEIDFDSVTNRCLSELKEKRDRMYSCIDLFDLMQSNNMKLRCIQHNNVFSLYCLTQHRVLCVNCIYGITKHRTHKVLPLKDCSEYIQEDNEKLKQILDLDLKEIENSIKIAQENSLILQRNMRKILQELNIQFKKKTDQLNFRYNRQVLEINSLYKGLIEKAKSVEIGLQQFKFKVWQTLSKVGLGKRVDNHGDATDSQIIRQVFCVSLSEVTKFEIKRITKRQLQRLDLKSKF